ncbi:hypothetical protein Rvan_1850 [Rhodomicrobium vannielii ATCC 17100]|uniref:Uncharacterized protein n=1 Tax=Rhodomicrobium vannielii (strain ATCC 17100 / DSM 162 / LMG 4299 / NCIMB 10020 / ATH 3.1.1) TaxID=648757 RepID=E3I057_RHOVT|nr:hypothetical protein [Rhodomicrobium vannielii]ADP71092.1 hypothetical protein Rvan_1850 [Rhodomicrobium vannielii ATCC 17100]
MEIQQFFCPNCRASVGLLVPHSSDISFNDGWFLWIPRFENARLSLNPNFGAALLSIAGRNREACFRGQGVVEVPEIAPPLARKLR